MKKKMGDEKVDKVKVVDDDSRAEQSRSREDCKQTKTRAGETASGDKVRQESRDDDDEVQSEKRWARPPTEGGDGRWHQGRWEPPKPRQHGQRRTGRTWSRVEQAQWRVRRDATRSGWLHRKQQSSRGRGQEHRWSEAPQVSGEGKSWARVVSE